MEPKTITSDTVERLKAQVMAASKTAPSFAFTVAWKDRNTDAEGWLAVDSVINGVTGGGIFMHPSATEEETRDIASNMSRKFTVTRPQIGGAKAGIRFDPRDPRAKGVLRRFIVDMALPLRNFWVTAGDLNTDDMFIERVIQEDVGLPTCQATLARRIASCTPGGKDLSLQMSRFLSEPASPFFPLVEGAVGYGLACAIEEAWKYGAASAPQTKTDNPLPRVAVVGFGAVGSSVSYYLHTRGTARVVAISDYEGYVHDSKGLDVISLLRERESAKESALPQDKQKHAKNLMCNLGYKKTREEWKAERCPPTQEGLERFLACEDIDVVCLCAQRYQMTGRVLSSLLANRWGGERASERPGRKWIICGANNVFGAHCDESLTSSPLCEDKKGMVEEMARRNNVCVVPDWVANSGTANLFHGLLLMDFSAVPAETAATVVLEACASPILRFLRESLEMAERDPLALSLACQCLAKRRLANPSPISEPLVLNPGKSRFCMPAPENPLPLEERLALVKQVGEEVLTDVELEKLLAGCQNPVCYDGFEPSGRMHVAQGLFKAWSVNRMAAAGFTFVFWIADWFAQMNHKMGGNLERIKTVGRYFIEVWRSAGMDTSRVRFVWASDEIVSRPNEYWQLVLDIANQNTLNNVKNCTQIMGRKESDSLYASQILYPVMQAADVMFLGVDVCQLGGDQRKVNVMMREWCAKTHREHVPVIVSHHMLMGLKKGQEKMSKSDPDSAIFMEDSCEDVERKIRSAFCPERQAENNPCMDYAKHLIFGRYQPGMPTAAVGPLDCEDGSRREFYTYQAFEKAYVEGMIHPKTLKAFLAQQLNDMIEPVRRHFRDSAEARALLEKVRSFAPTVPSPSS